ncbi:hypothetical protein [Streptacidiphilus neutrinimicus]|uniref:hypothetical protein n=1 Tax=Streptacidiphilus neutrinimicus TaxID=105420 RepID=UPI001377C40F|nr:hypothetical protein [Streptacidiphilus neutrinimicus]
MSCGVGPTDPPSPVGAAADDAVADVATREDPELEDPTREDAAGEVAADVDIGVDACCGGTTDCCGGAAGCVDTGGFRTEEAF